MSPKGPPLIFLIFCNRKIVKNPKWSPFYIFWHNQTVLKFSFLSEIRFSQYISTNDFFNFLRNYIPGSLRSTKKKVEARKISNIKKSILDDRFHRKQVRRKSTKIRNLLCYSCLREPNIFSRKQRNRNENRWNKKSLFESQKTPIRGAVAPQYFLCILLIRLIKLDTKRVFPNSCMLAVTI